MSNLAIFDALEQDKNLNKPKTKSLPPKTQRVCIDLPGEEFSCYVSEPNVEVMLRKHRDVVFDIKQGNGAIYTVEADQSDFYNARDKKLVERKKKHKITFKDDERLHIWVSRDFKGKLILKQGAILLGEYFPNQFDRTSYGPDPITKPEPMVIAIGKRQVASSVLGMCTKEDPFGMAANHEAQKEHYEQWLKDMRKHGSSIDYSRYLKSSESDIDEIQEYVVVAEVQSHEILSHVRTQLESGKAVQDFPEKIFAPITAETALVAASAKFADAISESTWKEVAGYAQEHWKQFSKLSMTVRVEQKIKGKFVAVFKGKVLAKKITSAVAKQVVGVAAQTVRTTVHRVPLGSASSAFLDGGFGKTGKAGYGGIKRISLTSASNFKSGIKIQIIGTVVDLYGDMSAVFGKNGSNDLSELLGRVGITLLKAGATAVLGSLLASMFLSWAVAGVVLVGIAAAPVLLIVGLVISGYIAAATLVEIVDSSVDGKERVAQWAR
jgi:hypothetical protein